MSGLVFLTVLAAALIHAGWNAVIRQSGNKLTSMLMLTVGQGMIGAAIAFSHPLPPAEIWLWLVPAGLIHMAYQLLLAYAYEHGDLSRVYPIARGTAPLIVALIGAFLLVDQVGPQEYFGVALLGFGILIMARGVFSNGESRRLLPFAFGSAIATAAYSLVDGMGARTWGEPLLFVAWLMVFSTLFFATTATALRGPVIFRASPRAWALGMVAAAASFTAFALVVWAMTQAPIVLVAALRETSILFAVLIGWLVFGETMGRGKALAAILIVSGVIMTRL